jgi:hypothetical protein
VANQLIETLSNNEVLMSVGEQAAALAENPHRIKR